MFLRGSIYLFQFENGENDVQETVETAISGVTSPKHGNVFVNLNVTIIDNLLLITGIIVCRSFVRMTSDPCRWPIRRGLSNPISGRIPCTRMLLLVQRYVIVVVFIVQ